MYARAGLITAVIAAIVNIGFMVAHGTLYAILASLIFYIGWSCVVLAAILYAKAYSAWTSEMRQYFVAGGVLFLISGAVWAYKISGGFSYIGSLIGPTLFLLLIVAYFILGAFLIAVGIERR